MKRKPAFIMKPKLRRPSPAMIVACLALFVASTGTSIAASHYLITSTKQIKPSVLKELKGARGPSGQGVTGQVGAQGPKGDTGAPGPKGDTGATGAEGAQGQQGSSGIVTTGVFNGSGVSLPGGVWAYFFVGNTATVTTTASQRLTGAAEVPTLSAASTSGQSFVYGLCYQPSSGGMLFNFAGSNYSTGRMYPEPRTFAAAASVVPGAGTWKVGFCVNNNSGANQIDTGYVNGWVQVTN